MPKKRKEPLRMCLGCREMRPKKDLTRLVCTSAGTVEIDPTGKRPGRGAYVCGSSDCVQRAVETRRLGKALRQGFSAEAVQNLRKELERREGGA
ncbi:MAG: YlxR family protein [Candidatus Desulforudis sp.]|nr:YlxR family protein [Desulforudis sp.]